jgi:ribulose-bisphosphate carboxylase large chain
MNYNIFKNINTGTLKDTHYICEYYLKSSSTLREAAWNLAIGQSIGNPSARSEFETQELIDDHSCLILADEDELKGKTEGIVFIAFPENNIDFATDGISQLLVQCMGGQMDIDIIKKCYLNDITFTTNMEKVLLGPKIGLSGMRKICNVDSRKPLFGGIVKPKIGLSPERHLDLVKQLIDGGCNFIKEDEILSNPKHCDVYKRTDLVMNYIRSQKSNVFYCVSINADSPFLLDRIVKLHEQNGINGVHTNFHCGFGIYKSIRQLDLPILLHYQKSGDRLLTHPTHDYHISQNLLFKIVSMSGCDTLHAGMIGGYLDDAENTLKSIDTLTKQNSVAALSCGMHPGLIEYIIKTVGHSDWMANVGGALSSHPLGTLAGTKAMRQSIDKDYGIEYQAAIKKWGLKVE